MRTTRFERKIILAIVAVGLAPLLSALWLGGAALREAYEVGVNPRVGEQLERGLETYRAHFVALRDDAERTADAVAYDYRLRDALERGEPLRPLFDRVLRTYPNVARVVVTREGQVIGSAENRDRLDTGEMRLLTQERTIGGDRVEVVIATSRARFLEYERAGEVKEVYSRLQSSASYLSGGYILAYMALLLVVIAIAVTAGIVLSRRVTRRVVDLAAATARVGAGDLDVEVPTGAQDEIGLLTRSFNAMVRDLKEARERIGYLQRVSAWQEFARRLAHEIKNPLTPIQLAVQEAHRGYRGDDARYRRTLEETRTVVEEEVATLRRLVGEFSAFARLPEAELSPSDLGDFVDDVSKAAEAVIEAERKAGPSIELRVERESGPLPVRIDAMMLRRCVDNLVRNAAQAIHEANREGVVILAVRRDGRHAILEIRDDGPGVPEGQRDRVFDPYITTKSEGTGLGLAIVKKVILEHGGDIACDPSAEGGARMRIRLPLLPT